MFRFWNHVDLRSHSRRDVLPCCLRDGLSVFEFLLEDVEGLSLDSGSVKGNNEGG